MPGHEVFECKEPDPIGLGFTEEGHGCAAVKAMTDTGRTGEGGNAGEGAGVEAIGAVGLGLETDTNVFDGSGEDGYGWVGGTVSPCLREQRSKEGESYCWQYRQWHRRGSIVRTLGLFAPGGS